MSAETDDANTEPSEPVTGEEWRWLSPMTVWAGIAVSSLIFGLPGLAIAVTATIAAEQWWLGPLIALASVLLVVVLAGYELLSYRRRQYRLTAERMELRSGVLSRTRLSLPRERIRNVDVARPLWSRPFGLCQVTVGTGQSGASGSEQLTLTYVNVAEGEWLRRTLLHQDSAPDPTDAGEAVAEAEPGAYDTSGVAEGAAAPASSELARMRGAWFGYGVVAPGPAAVAYSILGGLATAIVQFPLNWVFRVLGLDSTQGSPAVALAIVLGSALFVLAVGALGALLLNIEAWWNYRLTREPDRTLRVQRGLMNLSSVSIEERRLRGVRLRRYWPVRWVGGASVAAVASGLGNAGGSASKGGQGGGLVPKGTLSPEIPRQEAERIAAAALPGARFGPLRGHPRRALMRRLVRAGAVIAGVTALAVTWWATARFIVQGPTELPAVAWWGPALLLAAVTVLAVAYAIASYRGLGYALGERQLYIRRGVATRATVALNRDAVIGWTVRRSPFQRRLGLATIGATVAADQGVFYAVDVNTQLGLTFAEEAVPGLLTPFLEGPRWRV